MSERCTDCKRSRFNTTVPVVLLLFVMLGLAALPLQAAAADAWDKAMEEINASYDETAVIKAVTAEQAKGIAELRSANNTGLKSWKAQVEHFNSVRLTSLKEADAAVKSRHSKLLKQYTSLGKQLQAAREAGQEKQVTLLNLKRNRLMPAYASARSEMRAAAAAYSSARKQAAARLTPVTETLAKVSQQKKIIAADNKVIAEIRKQRAASDKGFRTAVKAGDAVTAVKELHSLQTQLKLLKSQQAAVYEREKEIAVLLRTIQTKFPD